MEKEYKVTVINKCGTRNATTYYTEERAIREVKRLKKIKKQHGEKCEIRSAELRTVIVEKII